MGETEVTKRRIVFNKHNKGGIKKVFNPAFSSFLSQLPNKLQNGLKSQLNRLATTAERKNSLSSFLRREKGSSIALEVDKEKQLRAWRENPLWVDLPPKIKVSVPEGSLCNLNVEVTVGLPPDAVYDIVIDPDNRRVFKNIKEVLSRKVLLDDGQRQVVEVEQAALWKFLWFSGTIPVHVTVDQNRKDYSMKFKQVKTGFMEKFEGSWRVEPVFVDENVCFPFKPKTWADYNSCTKGRGRIGSKVTLDQLIQPAIVPPPPISWYLRGITSKTTEMLINDLLAETARIREGFNDMKSNEEELEVPQEKNEERRVVDIKERWALRRRHAKKHKTFP